MKSSWNLLDGRDYLGTMFDIQKNSWILSKETPNLAQRLS